VAGLRYCVGWFFKADVAIDRNDRNVQQSNSAGASAATSAGVSTCSTVTADDQAAHRPDVATTDDTAAAAAPLVAQRFSSSAGTGMVTVADIHDVQADQQLLPSPPPADDTATSTDARAGYDMECSDETILEVIDKSSNVSTCITNSCEG